MKSGSKTAANILRYKNTKKSIRDHVDPEDKMTHSQVSIVVRHLKMLQPLFQSESGDFSSLHFTVAQCSL